MRVFVVVSENCYGIAVLRFRVPLGSDLETLSVILSISELSWTSLGEKQFPKLL